MAYLQMIDDDWLINPMHPNTVCDCTADPLVIMPQLYFLSRHGWVHRDIISYTIYTIYCIIYIYIYCILYIYISYIYISYIYYYILLHMIYVFKLSIAMLNEQMVLRPLRPLRPLGPRGSCSWPCWLQALWPCRPGVTARMKSHGSIDQMNQLIISHY